MKVSLQDRVFDVVETRTAKAGDDKTVEVAFSVDIDGVIHPLAITYDEDVRSAATAGFQPGLDDEFQYILEQSIQMNIFEIVNGVASKDVTSGLRPDLIKSWVQEFGTEHLDSEVQHTYMNIIEEALK